MANMNESHHTVMVLADRETFTEVVGCEIRVLTQEEMDAVDSGEKKISEVGFATNRAVKNGEAWYWHNV